MPWAGALVGTVTGWSLLLEWLSYGHGSLKEMLLNALPQSCSCTSNEAPRAQIDTLLRDDARRASASAPPPACFSATRSARATATLPEHWARRLDEANRVLSGPVISRDAGSSVPS